jgi:hypothetical protein
MPKAPKESGSGPATTPARYPEVPPPQVYPSGDYSYILEIVMAMQNTMGKLTEAVESLKAQSSRHGEKLEQIGKDVHAAKVVVSAVGGLILLVECVMQNADYPRPCERV